MTDPRAEIFAAFRKAKSGVFNEAPERIAILDGICDDFGIPRAASASVRRISPAGLALIKSFEGLRLQAYPDPGSGGEPWTVGVGTTIYPDGRKVRKGDTITEAQAEEYLRHDLARFEAAVNRLTGGVTTQGQFDALTSLTYNIGEGGLKTSTLLRKHNEGDYAGAKAEFARWNKAGGKVLNGLVRRRAAEAELYGK